MNIFSSDFQKRWNEFSTDVSKLNEYTATHPDVELKNTKVEGANIDGVIFNGAVFDRVVFNDVSSKMSKYLKVKFINCTFVNFRAWNSEFVDVVFDNCEFISTNFLGSKVLNVKIKGCKGESAEFDDLRGNELVVEDTTLNDRSSFTDGKIPFVFRNTKLIGVNMMGLSGNNPLLIEGGLLDEVNFGKSQFSTVTLRRVRQGEGPTRFNSVIADSFRFEDVYMTRGVSLAYVTTPLVSIEGGTFRGATEGSTIAKVYALNVNLFMYDMSEATMPYVIIDNCEIQDLAIWECNAKEMSITNSTVNGLDATDLKGDIVIWDNVTLDGKIDLTNAQINDFQPTRLKRGPQLQLITTGSNMRF